MRAKFIWDNARGDWVPAHLYFGKCTSNGVMVVPDIQPYKSMQTGEMITGRRQHRDHLRAHGLVELGNDVPRQERITSTARERVDSIKQAMQQVRDGRGVSARGRYGDWNQ